MQNCNGESGIKIDYDAVMLLATEIEQLLPPTNCHYCEDQGKNWPFPYDSVWVCPYCDAEYRD